MSPEAAEAIRIADKHLAGEPAERRKALAQDIVLAICRHAERIAMDAVRTVERDAVPVLLAAAKDALSGWQYIRQHHGDLYGVGWDRVESALTAAVAKVTGGNVN